MPARNALSCGCVCVCVLKIQMQMNVCTHTIKHWSRLHLSRRSVSNPPICTRQRERSIGNILKIFSFLAPSHPSNTPLPSRSTPLVNEKVNSSACVLTIAIYVPLSKTYCVWRGNSNVAWPAFHSERSCLVRAQAALRALLHCTLNCALQSTSVKLHSHHAPKTFRAPPWECQLFYVTQSTCLRANQSLHFASFTYCF